MRVTVVVVLTVAALVGLVAAIAVSSRIITSLI